MTDRKTKMIVPNDRLKLLVVEKTLPKNGGFSYLYKGGEAGYEEQLERITESNKMPDAKKKQLYADGYSGILSFALLSSL